MMNPSARACRAEPDKHQSASCSRVKAGHLACSTVISEISTFPDTRYYNVGVYACQMAEACAVDAGCDVSCPPSSPL
eukprot:15116-Eustigmatos_ZCMA.PRE.1